MIRLRKVKEEDRTLLWNVLQKYLHEMTQYYPEKVDRQGNYPYKYFDAYFTDAERKAFFIYDDSTLVGFAMLNPYSSIEHKPDYTIAEFTIFPPYRRNHYALDAMNLILLAFRGNWEIKYNKKNRGAKKLWTIITSPYSPFEYCVNKNDIVLEFRN